MRTKRFQLWWCKNGNVDVGVEVCEMVVEVRRVSDRVMPMVLVLKEDVVSQICGYTTQSGS